MDGKEDYRICPSCGMRCLVFSGIRHDSFDVLFEKEFFSFDAVVCQLCGWKHENFRNGG